MKYMRSSMGFSGSKQNCLPLLITGIIWYEKGNCGGSSSVCLLFYHSCDSWQTFCLSNKFTHFVCQSVFLKLRMYLQNTWFPSVETTSFPVALGALLIWRVAVVCFFLVLLQTLELREVLTKIFIAVDYWTAVLWWCVCITMATTIFQSIFPCM